MDKDNTRQESPTSSTPLKRCKTCKWWQNEPEDEYWGGKYHISPDKPWNPDEKMPVDFEVRYCTHPKLVFCERPEERDTFAVADGSYYMANLYTAEDFGCVLHAQGEPGSGGLGRFGAICGPGLTLSK